MGDTKVTATLKQVDTGIPVTAVRGITIVFVLRKSLLAVRFLPPFHDEFCGFRAHDDSHAQSSC